MTRTEINSILAAAATKQTWIVKEFEKFMDAWAAATETPSGYEGPKKLILWEHDTGNERGEILRYFIEIEDNRLDYDYTNDYMDSWENGSNFADVTVAKARRAIKEIEEKLPDFFRKIQSGIDQDSEAGRKITAITAKLTA